MAESNVVIKFTADTEQFRRDIKRTSRWMLWRLWSPAIVAGAVGSVLADLIWRAAA